MVDLGSPASSQSVCIPPPRSSRRIQLRPVLPSDHEFLYRLATDEQLGFRWRFNGYMPSIEAFVSSLYAPEVFVQFAVDSATSGERIGYSVAYNADLRNRHAFYALLMADNPAGGAHLGVGAETAILSLNYLFQTWDFHRVYVEVAEYNLPQFESVIGHVFTEEGRLTENLWYAGRWWDKLMLTCTREASSQVVEPLVERLIVKTGTVS